MRQFLIQLLPYFLVAAVLQGIGDIQQSYFAGEGDLIRLGRLFPRRYYKDTPPMSPAQSAEYHEVLLVGDSHLDQAPRQRRFQHYLTTPTSSHSYWSYEKGQNPIITAIRLIHQNKLQPKVLIIEIIERNLVSSTIDFLRCKDFSQPLEAKPWSKKRITFPYHIDEGVASLLSIASVQNSWFNNHRCTKLKTTTPPPLFNNHNLLLLSESINNRKPISETEKFILVLNDSLHKILDPLEIPFVVYIIPDKATVYSNHFDSSILPPSVLDHDPLSGIISSPVVELRQAVADGQMEVYKYSDTHLGESGARIVGIHLQNVISSVIQHCNTNALQQR